jgi:hypothetical protein
VWLVVISLPKEGCLLLYALDDTTRPYFVEIRMIICLLCLDGSLVALGSPPVGS